MTDQLSFFDTMRAPAIRKPVERDGRVIRRKIETVLRLAHPKLAWAQARIEVHPSGEYWMWATGYNTGQGGSGYRVGEKWGKFAHTREDAIYWACNEIRTALAKREETKGTRSIQRWLSEIEASL
ncbi:MAG: hypothetical protein AAGH90_10660 [Pseudomonadota bacterium]